MFFKQSNKQLLKKLEIIVAILLIIGTLGLLMVPFLT